MIEMLEANWLFAVIALFVGLLVAWYVFHASRRTRITGARRDVLDDDASPAMRNRTLIDSAPAKVGGDFAKPPIPVVTPEGLAGVGTAVAASAEDAQCQTNSAAPDELTRIKGVGPKLMARLHELGVTRFAQIAAWDDSEIDRIDSSLGRFEGRIRRDDWVGQAKLLATGDESGFADRYGKLG